MTSVIKAMLLSMLLALGLHASDLLSKATGGSISDNTFGVKELSVSEMKNIKGGYRLTGVIDISNTSVAVIAIPHYDSELGLVYNDAGLLDIEKSTLRDRGICGLNVTECYLNSQTQTHSQANRDRLLQYYQAMGSTYDLMHYALVYIMEKQIRTTPGGTHYRANVARLGAFDYSTRTIHSVNYALALEHNPIVKEIQKAADNALVSRLNELAKMQR